IRGLGDAELFCTTGEHMYRPEEIFAEDFRFLFGCEASCYSGTIENPYIELPSEVEGLESFMISMISSAVASADVPAAGGVVSAMNYPNPFNPSTTISMEISGAGEGVPVDVAVYSVDGRLVRRLYSGHAAPGRFDVTWDGRNDGGRMVSSGTYFYSIISSGGKVTGKMLLVR
ncbi:MAG TPA: FlgD immunoglobulin-like domain containing protein, partial [Candidatus Krumholzibacterium sp.]|nr:FlgD immunoglobulin-like domain containing protein [Candidatus Krumholzibacterium sp.]